MIFLLKYFGISVEILLYFHLNDICLYGGHLFVWGRLQWNCWFVTKEEASSENNFSKKPRWLYSIWLRILLLQTVTKGGILKISQLRISNWGEILKKNVNSTFGTLKAVEYPRKSEVRNSYVREGGNILNISLQRRNYLRTITLRQ